MAEKDNFQLQSQRIHQMVKQLCPTCVVIFDENRMPNWLRFRIEDALGTILTLAHPEYHVSEVADWTDDKMRQIVESLTGGRLRRALEEDSNCNACGHAKSKHRNGSCEGNEHFGPGVKSVPVCECTEFLEPVKKPATR